MSHILDRLDEIEKAVPLLAGRIDHAKIAVAGHSFGGFTSSLLLGARVTDDGEEVSLLEPRIKAGVLLAAPGRGDVINGPMADMLPVFRTIDFSTMTAPALVVAGDEDDSRHFTDMGPDWHADPYTLAPGPKALLTLFGAGHALGGIPGYDVAETTDESPERVAAVGSLTSAYLRSRLHPGDNTWQTAREALPAAPTRSDESKPSRPFAGTTPNGRSAPSPPSAGFWHCWTRSEPCSGASTGPKRRPPTSTAAVSSATTPGSTRRRRSATSTPCGCTPHRRPQKAGEGAVEPGAGQSPPAGPPRRTAPAAANPGNGGAAARPRPDGRS